MHSCVVTAREEHNPLRRVMEALPLAERGALEPSELSSLLPDVAILRRRVRQVASLSAAFDSIDTSPYVKRLSARAAQARIHRKLAARPARTA
jgi:hypothetical protein